MSTIATTESQASQPAATSAGGHPLGPRSRAPEPRSDASERDQLTDRLHSLRRLLPVLAQEMAAARRQAAHLKVDNRRLAEQVRELRARLEVRDRG